MRTIQALVGMPLVIAKTGEEIGRVYDGFMDGNKIVGFSIKKHDSFVLNHAFLTLDAISSVGDGAIMITDEAALNKKMPKDTQLYPVCMGKRRFKGKHVLSDEGMVLGLAEDVYFSIERGTIIGYEVTDGWLSDIKEGRKVIKGHDLLICKERANLSL